MIIVPPNVSGVYQIRCIPTGKIYIGSAVNVRKRWGEHWRNLRRNRHGNRYLQHAWNKHGEENFVFLIVEYASRQNLLEAEQEWITSTGCTDKTIGFNICITADASGGTNIQIWEGFIDPEGSEVSIVGLQEFCECHQLDYRSMHRLAAGKGKLKSYKGWTHRNSVRQRDYIKTYEGFIDSEGNIVELITNLAEFCRQHGLDNTHMLAVANGRICSHRGWTHVHSRKRKDSKTHTGFVNPNGERVVITNLAEFCRQNALHPVHMHQLKSGQRKKHKGWTWREEKDENTYL